MILMGNSDLEKRHFLTTRFLVALFYGTSEASKKIAMNPAAQREREKEGAHEDASKHRNKMWYGFGGSPYRFMAF